MHWIERILNIWLLSSWAGLEIKPDREGILFVMDKRGRATGEAFVQFESQDDTEQALGRNRDKIGHRWVVTLIFIVSNNKPHTSLLNNTINMYNYHLPFF